MITPDGIIFAVCLGDVYIDKFVLVYNSVLHELNRRIKYTSASLKNMCYNFEEYEESCHPIHHLPNLKAIMNTLAKCLNIKIIKHEALEAMFEEDSSLFFETFLECYPTFTSSYAIDGYAVSHLYNTLKLSSLFRQLVFFHHYRIHAINKKKCTLHKFGMKHFITVRIDLQSPKRDIVDYAWGSRIQNLVLQRRELDNAMAWLSTLGGAFSALGDYKVNFALVAGDISLRQFKIALQLGDPMIMLRCKLYYSLSLIQRGYLNCAKKIIRVQYKLAKSSVVVDTKAISMCLGIWSRLGYEYKKKKKNVKTD